MVKPKLITLGEFTSIEKDGLSKDSRELAGLLRDIAHAAKKIDKEIKKAALADLYGETGAINVQGEKVQKLDVFANEQFTTAIKRGMHCAGIVSEEIVDFVAFDDAEGRNSKYVCMFDPLDGSSNIDVNVSIGSIFGIYRRVTAPGNLAKLKDFLQPGKKQVAAGYITYGSSTMLIYANDWGVNGFTFDATTGEFCLSHPHIRCPESGEIYSVNHANFFHFSDRVKKYITKCQEKANTNGQRYTQRYTGSLVADVHRNLMKGGIFMYPATSAHKHGKLRLLYECNPLAYIIEKAGGMATDGTGRILEIIPKQLHERSPVFIGSRDMVRGLILA